MPSPGVRLWAWVPSPILHGRFGLCCPCVYFLPTILARSPADGFVLMLCLSHTQMRILFVSPAFVCMFGAEELCQSVILWILLNGKCSFVFQRKEGEKV